jgi:hypothetical protein
MHPAPDRAGVSTRRLVVFLVLGVLLIIGGTIQGLHGWYAILIGAVLVAYNGTDLLRRHGRRDQ